MFFLYVAIGFTIFIISCTTFYFNKKLIYRRAVLQMLAKNKTGQQLQQRIASEDDQAFRQELLILQAQIIKHGFNHAQMANITAQQLINRLEEKLKNKPIE